MSEPQFAREAIYAALFALVAASPAFRTATRRIKDYSDVDQATQPALLQVELGDFGNAKFPQGFPRPFDGRAGRLLPGLLAGTDQLDDFVDALGHVVLPFGIRQDAGCSCRQQG